MYDIAIIGAGPGGYVAAIRAAQLGATVALIEKDEVGGVCLNRGCIPSKTIISCTEKYNEVKKLSKYGIAAGNITVDYKIIYDRKNQTVEKLQKSLTTLIKNKKVTLIKGEAVIESANTLTVKEELVEFKNLIIATGSHPVSLPGLEVDHKFIINSDDILLLDELPNSTLIVGSGAIGLEWARILNSLGKQVYIVEMADRLCPMGDGEVSEYLEKLARRMKMPVYKGTTIKKIDSNKVTLSDGAEITVEAVFLAAGRQPNTNINGIEQLNIEKNRNFIKVNTNLQTNIPHIYAIGDVTGLYQLAHVASHQGIKAVEHILLGKEVDISYNLVPSVIYGKPEIASVGYTEEALIKQEIPYKKSIFPMSAIGRAQAEDKIEGFVKVLADESKILGVHIIAECAGELIEQANIAMAGNISAKDLTEMIFPHPSYSEAIHEAFLGIIGECIHK